MSTFNTFTNQITNISSTLDLIKNISNHDNTNIKPTQINRKDSFNSTSYKLPYNNSTNCNKSESTCSSSSSEESSSLQEGQEGVSDGDGDKVNSLLKIINNNSEILQKVQELNILKSIVSNYEDSIRQLYGKKVSKHNKIDDLRYLIRRIAKEDYSNFRSNDKKPKSENGLSSLHCTKCTRINSEFEETEETSSNEGATDHPTGCFIDCHFRMCSLYWQNAFDNSSIPSLCNKA